MHATRLERDTAKSSAVKRQSVRLVHAAGADPAGESDEPGQPVIAKGKGGAVTDVDRNEYVDFDAGGGSVLLGHADERVLAAITKTVAKGHGFSGPSEALVRLAELVLSRFPAIEGLRVASTSRSALACSMELAQRATGRNLIVACEGQSASHFRGRQPELRTVPYNDPASAERVLVEHGEGVAAFILEPVSTSMGLVPPSDGYLGRLRALCDKYGSLLVYDETTTGLRLGPGGAAKLFGVSPDLTCLGGSLAGGLPLGVIGGRVDLVEASSERDGGPDPGWRGSELALAAALASLQASADAGFYEELDEKAALLEKGVNDAVGSAGAQVYVTRVCSLLGLFLGREPVISAPAGHPADACSRGGFRAAVLDGGVLPPAPCRPWAVMSAHTEAQIEQAVRVVGDGLRRAATEPSRP